MLQMLYCQLRQMWGGQQTYFVSESKRAASTFLIIWEGSHGSVKYFVWVKEGIYISVLGGAMVRGVDKRKRDKEGIDTFCGRSHGQRGGQMLGDKEGIGGAMVRGCGHKKRGGIEIQLRPDGDSALNEIGRTL